MSTQQTDAFFPDTITDRRQKWYSFNLQSMNEQSIFASRNSLPKSVYRFLWLGFNEHPLCIRIEQETGKPAQLFAKKTDGIGEMEPCNILLEKEMQITAEQFAELERQLDSISFWTLPTSEDVPLGTDGERWIFEALHSGRYHIVDRWCPQIIARDRPLVELGRLFVGAAQLE